MEAAPVSPTNELVGRALLHEVSALLHGQADVLEAINQHHQPELNPRFIANRRCHGCGNRWPCTTRQLLDERP